MLKTKIIIALFLVISVLQNAICQTRENQTSLKAGINVNNLGGKEVGMNNSIGFHAGFSREYILSDDFSFQPELLFSLQGAVVYQSYNIRLNYYYLNLPLLAKIYLVDDLSIEAGPQVGYLLWANHQSDFFKENITDQVKRIDFSAVLGLGYKYRNKIGFSARYNLGFSNTNEQRVIFSRRQNNRVFQASVSLFL